MAARRKAAAPAVAENPTSHWRDWSSLVGHDDLTRRLRLMVKNSRVPHAILLCGPAGIGKARLADALASALLCGDEFDRPCGDCESCRRMKAGTHPDLLFLAPQGEKNPLIKIEAVREILAAATMVPAVSERRVIVIEAADAMNVQAANSLLKSLEEPSGETVFILTAERREGLLPTILSRVMPVAVTPLTDAAVAQVLAAQGVAEPELWAALSGGSPGRAMALAAGGGSGSRDTAWQLWREINELTAPKIFAKGEELAKMSRPELAELVRWVQLFIHDMLRLSVGGANVANRDKAADMGEMLAAWDRRKLAAAEKLTVTARRQLTGSNMNARLAAEAWLIRLRGLR